jgi:hypothetical protein
MSIVWYWSVFLFFSCEGYTNKVLRQGVDYVLCETENFFDYFY